MCYACGGSTTIRVDPFRCACGSCLNRSGGARRPRSFLGQRAAPFSLVVRRSRRRSTIYWGAAPCISRKMWRGHRTAVCVAGARRNGPRVYGSRSSGRLRPSIRTVRNQRQLGLSDPCSSGRSCRAPGSGVLVVSSRAVHRSGCHPETSWATIGRMASQGLGSGPNSAAVSMGQRRRRGRHRTSRSRIPLIRQGLTAPPRLPADSPPALI